MTESTAIGFLILKILFPTFSNMITFIIEKFCNIPYVVETDDKACKSVLHYETETIETYLIFNAQIRELKQCELC